MAEIFGLYLVLTDPVTGYEACAEAAVETGVRYVQLRMKKRSSQEVLETARRLRRITAGSGTLFIVNDDPRLAAAVDADGVHVGEDDGDLAQVRAIVGAERIVGVSCYNEYPKAEAATAAGADYVAFGSFFPSGVKPGARRADFSLLRRAGRLGVPVVAIGGITAANGAGLVAAGADALAVITAVFGAADVEAAARAIAALRQR